MKSSEITMIRAEDLTKSFGQLKAVDGVSFTIRKGEVVGFLGPNGAGKTTIMRLLTGYYSPDRGTVEIAGIAMDGQPTEAQRHIGYLPENNPLYREMLVSEFLGLAADLKQIPKGERREALDFAVSSVAIGDVFYRPVGELSKGYRQRVGLAAALLHRPDILILDEPTEGLDPNQRTEIRGLIKELARNHTVILSTHVMQEAQAVCSRIFIMNKGRLVADGAPEELSRLARREQTVVVELEGDGAAQALDTLQGVRQVEMEERDGRVRARLTVGMEVEVQREISRLVRERGWTVWRLAEEGHTLEDVFHRLTSEE